jgi:hypothetical protein
MEVGSSRNLISLFVFSRSPLVAVSSSLPELLFLDHVPELLFLDHVPELNSDLLFPALGSHTI